jgi:hypothetical protein
MWDSVYTVMNVDLTLSLMAVRLEHPYRQYLDDQSSLCPERKVSGKSHERVWPDTKRPCSAASCSVN